MLSQVHIEASVYQILNSSGVADSSLGFLVRVWPKVSHLGVHGSKQMMERGANLAQVDGVNANKAKSEEPEKLEFGWEVVCKVQGTRWSNI